MSPLQLIALGGMLVLAGVAVLFRALRPSPPRLSAVMAQLNAQPTRTATPVGNVDSAPERSWVPAAAIAFAERHLGAREEDLAILGRSRAEMAGTKLGWAAGGALFPGLLSLILALGGIRMPFAIPAVAAVVLAVLAWANPSRQVAEDAEKARAEFRSALAAYLALVGLERKARGSPAEALEEASRVSGSRPFRLIHTEVLRAELAAQPPWAALRELAGASRSRSWSTSPTSSAPPPTAPPCSTPSWPRPAACATPTTSPSRPKPPKPTSGSSPRTCACSPASAPCSSTRPRAASSAARAAT